MKGAIFIALNEMIEQTHGIQLWEELLDEIQPSSGGVYTSTQDYPEEEVVDFIRVISLKTQSSEAETERAFGCFLFSILNGKYPMFTQSSSSFFQFLGSIHGVIHKEVRKLYSEPGLPDIECDVYDDHSMTMKYRSPRQMCFLAEGLIQGAAQFYQHEISIEHATCMHDGNDHCALNISIIKNLASQ